jgi:Flp pilus assembly protein TadD
MLRAGPCTRVAAIALLIFRFSTVSSKARAADEQLCDVSADYALGREDYRAAVMLHRRLVQSEPDNALAHYHLGFAYGMLGRDAEELSEYRTSARLGLKNWDLFLNLGLAYLGEHELARATEALETAVSLGPEHAEAHFNLAIAYESEKRLGAALREITAARRLAPEDPDVANANAIICVETGDLVDAHDIWIYLLEIAPDYRPARANLSILNRSLTRNRQFDRNLELSYSHAEASAGHAARKRELANLQTAIEIDGRRK